ncbi:LysR family transcriptional regulator [Pseudomonas lalucatii]|uniref:LysR family transcriptional regulator n=1 Tax=Pseudomonas lalucatii TaxID=1424203 RepID=A0ABS5PWH9_9PSED|nr:LysR family transcriptional regulator [Pseudomonas lalucatii]MBS7660861.1 LysR family transcriptional regulator [Pseudomonas lalucatii]MBS7724410.1 LysR family transcriptional regulator [Pseudomonas lalucatii]QVM87605.1 LysR family transcriptional regulator [Pseudomonas lalucatii]
MNKLELLRTFVRVTELASFTQAGESLGLPRSTVSEQVRALEALLGARLLHRTTRRVHATQDGLVLYERSKDMLAHMDELEGLFRQDGTALAGRLRVDMPSSVARKIVLPRLAEFVARHPQVELEISSSDRQVDLVGEGFDCVLRVGELPDTSLVARRLSGFSMVNCASPAYLQAYGTPATLEDLAAHRLIHYVPVLGARSTGFDYVANGRLRQVPMTGNVTVNNTDAYEAACLGGLGLIQAPLAGVRDYLASGRLCAVLPDYLAPPMAVSLLYADRRYLPQRVRVFMQWLEGLIEAEARV